MYDLVLKGGRLLDPEQGVDSKKDIAIRKGRVVDVETSISASKGRRVLDVSGKVVTPGFVDLHTHVADDVVRLGVDPDKTCLPYGATTVVDAGSTGELNFRTFKRYVIDRCTTRVFAFINVESLGMIEFVLDPPSMTDQAWARMITGMDDIFAPLFVNRKNLVSTIRRNRKTIVGIKWAHHGIPLLDIARSVADEVGCRIMAENVMVPDNLKRLKRGDIITHVYLPSDTSIRGRGNGLRAGGARKILPEFFEAVKRGVLLDIGHGMGSFSWVEAANALKEGLPPDTISSDLWSGSVNGPAYNLPTTMNKLFYLGMPFEEIVKATTARPASVIGERGKLGTLKPGAAGDVAVLRLAEGRFPLVDVEGKRKLARQGIVVTDVIKGGRVVKSSGS